MEEIESNVKLPYHGLNAEKLDVVWGEPLVFDQDVVPGEKITEEYKIAYDSFRQSYIRLTYKNDKC